MIEAIFSASAAIAPVFITILGGYTLRETKIMPLEAWGGVNRLAFYVLGPMYLLELITRADISGAGTAKLIAALMCGVALMALAALCARPLLKDPQGFACVFQSAVRWNAVIMLAAAPRLIGAQGTALLAVAIAPMTVTTNILAVIGFNIWGAKNKSYKADWLRSFFLNPLLLGSIAGALLLLVNFHFPEPFLSVIHMCGLGSIPLILLCVGAGLDFGAMARAPVYMTFGCLLRLLCGPAAMFLAAEIWDLHGIARIVAIAAGATPTAASGYVLAQQMGGDDKLMAGLVTATTLFSAITMPLVLTLLGA